MQDIDLAMKGKEIFTCTPVIMEKVCASGSKCFHDIHYLFETESGCPIPADACPINCVVSNFVICGMDNETLPHGVLGPRRVGNCVMFTVSYRVRVWFEFFDSGDGALEVGMASQNFERELSIPVENINGGCVLCQPETVELCIRRLNLDCIRAIVVPRPEGFPCNFPPFAIEVTVEKEFFALESGRSIICIPTCVQECIELPFPVSPGECIPFERIPKCPDFCQETDLQPGRCAQCPPPQP